MFKTAKDYAAQISRLKAEKEELDARQVQMQRDRKNEMERLRTEFMFKVFISHSFFQSIRYIWFFSNRKRKRHEGHRLCGLRER